MSSQNQLLGLAIGARIKKQLYIALAAMYIILALPCLAVFSLGSGTLTLLATVPDITAAETKGFYTGGAVPGNTYAWGNCTYWVYAMRLWAGAPISTGWGNANTWDDRARVDGYIVDHIPQAGAIYQTDEGGWGHVAYVVSIDDTTGDYTISEMNAPDLNVVSQGTFSHASAAQYNFIHQLQGAPQWNPKDISLGSHSIGTN